jgi:hypothetical protein
MKTFNEVFKEIQDSVPVSKKGKAKKTFSKTDFDRLLKAFLNDYGYTTKQASTNAGELVLTDLTPVKQFRDVVITKILTDNGYDKAEAAKIASEYEFTKVDGLYEIISEVIYQYMNAGKKFSFITKEDFNGSLTLDDIGEETKERTAPGKPNDKFKVKTKAHKKLKTKSSANKWLKKKFN